MIIRYLRLPVELTAEVDKWAEGHKANRSEAIRRLVELGLKAKPRT
jgi:metal-responsive CopG/Arc/MetJ family transcriptional regulator